MFVIDISALALGGFEGHEEVRMEDLLQAQFDNELNLLLFEGSATFSINMLIHQINKSAWSLRLQRDAESTQSFTANTK